jgi:hypothetical protein
MRIWSLRIRREVLAARKKTVGERQEVTSPEWGTNELVVYSHDDVLEPPQLQYMYSMLTGRG